MSYTTSGLIKKVILASLLFTAPLFLSACEDALDAFFMKKYVSKAEKRLESKQKKNAALGSTLLKPSFMFSDDEKYFKNHLLLKEDFFLLDRYKFINSSSVSNFVVDQDNNFVIYDKASSYLLTFNKYGVLTGRVKLNFGGESRILAPSNMVREANGNIVMTCSILGRFYRFTPDGVLLNAADITENEGSLLKRMFALKVFSDVKYTVLIEYNSKKIFVYENGTKIFDLKHEMMQDDAYVYFSPQNDIYIVDSASSSILNIAPVLNAAGGGKNYKYSLKTYAGDKILKNSAGHVFIFKKNERIIEKIDSKGVVVSSYGAVKAADITFENNLFPCDFAIGPDDSLYILDDKNYKINVYAESGVFSFSFGGYGRNAGRFLSPYKITVDRLKRIIISDKDKKSAMVFNSKGEYIEHYGDILGSNSLRYYGIYADVHDKIHILDYISNQHYTINYNFHFLKILNDIFSKKTNYPQNFFTCDHVACFNFFDLNAQKCYKLSPDAKLESIDIPSEITSVKIEPRKIFVNSIACDGAGGILGLCKNEAFLYKFDITGRDSGRFTMTDTGKSYSSLAVDAFNNFYLIGKKDNRIFKFDPAGKLLKTFETGNDASLDGEVFSLLTFMKNNAAIACLRDRKNIAVFNTFEGFSFDSARTIGEDFALKEPFKILDAAAADENIFVLCTSGGNLMMLKYRLTDYFREGVSFFSRGLFQEALVAFEKHRRLAAQPGPNALFYMAQCYRKISKNYEAALIEAEISQKYPASHAAKRLEN